MIKSSIAGGIGGLVTQPMHIMDWWQPLTITGTRIGIEDFLIGFALGGIMSVIYEICMARVSIYTGTMPRIVDKAKRLSIKILFIVLILLCFFVFNMHSAYAIIVPCSLVWITCIIMRRDLIMPLFMSGILSLIMGIIVYFCLFLLYPDFIQRFWYLPDMWLSYLLFGIPVGEYLWFFIVGSIMGPLGSLLRGEVYQKITLPNFFKNGLLGPQNVYFQKTHPSNMSYVALSAEIHHVDSVLTLINSDPAHLLPRTRDDVVGLLGSFFVVCDQGVVIGCICFEVYSSKLGELRSLYVSPAYRGCGIATILIQRVIDFAREKNITEILTITSALELFQKCGFSYSLPSEKQALFYSLRR